MQSSYVGLQALIDRAMDALEQGVKDSLDDVRPKVEAETPVLSGDLQRTVDTTKPVRRARSVSGKVTAGSDTGTDSALEYGVIVHEKHPDHGTHFLRNPVLEHIPAHVEHIASATRRKF